MEKRIGQKANITFRINKEKEKMKDSGGRESRSGEVFSFSLLANSSFRRELVEHTSETKKNAPVGKPIQPAGGRLTAGRWTGCGVPYENTLN
jgi:hypothetical protein